MIKVSDFVFSYLQSKGIDTVFLVTGGGAMHLNDSVGRAKGVKYYCNHHEQACAMAAEAYARVTNKPAIVSVTTGPGCINALNGVFGAFTDSMPMIIISGQVKRETMMSSYNIPGLRQLGDQELDIVSMVKGITKFSYCVIEPESIKYYIEKALYIATNGRPGPVWIDIPVDVQGTKIDETNLKSYIPEEGIKPDNSNLSRDVSKVIKEIERAKRPVFIGSTGLRIANAIEDFEETLSLSGIPVVSAWCHDFIDHSHKQYVGKQGTIGDRAGNFAVQNSDCVIIIGSRMPIRQVSFNWENFAKKAFKIQIDIDKIEMTKPTIKLDLALNYDAKDFLMEFNKQIKSKAELKNKFEDWLKWCIERKIKYPILLERHKTKDKLNPYHFLSRLQEELKSDEIIACGDGSAIVITSQTSKIKKGQILFHNGGCASMGYDLPAAIGCAIAAPKRRIICLAGDGSIQMNLQELQTIIHHRFNIKIFVLDNGGYLSVKQTQKNFFGLAVGADANSGVSFPNMIKIANAYGIPTFEITNIDFEDTLDKIFKTEGPTLCNVVLERGQIFEPKLSSKILPDGKMVSASLEDMFPFLSDEELKSNIIE